MKFNGLSCFISSLSCSLPLALAGVTWVSVVSACFASSELSPGFDWDSIALLIIPIAWKTSETNLNKSITLGFWMLSIKRGAYLDSSTCDVKMRLNPQYGTFPLGLSTSWCSVDAYAWRKKAIKKNHETRLAIKPKKLTLKSSISMFSTEADI